MTDICLLNEPAILSLDEKTGMSRKMLREAISIASNPVVCFSGGKKSVVLLHLIKQEFPKIPRVLYVQTGNEFENVRSFVEKMRKLWQLDLVVEASGSDTPGNTPVCCRIIVGKEIAGYAKQTGADLLIIGDTIEDAGAIRVEDVPLDIALHPISCFTDQDIFSYIEKYRLPKCSLYDQGYTKIGCQLCTPSPVNNSYATDLEKEKIIKEKLRRLGYL